VTCLVVMDHQLDVRVACAQPRAERREESTLLRATQRHRIPRDELVGARLVLQRQAPKGDLQAAASGGTTQAVPSHRQAESNGGG
jgi:hypothetical protein